MTLRFALPVCVVWVAGGLAFPALAAAGGQPHVILESVDAAALEPDRALAVANVTVDAGPAILELRRGTIYPSRPVGSRTVEMVFLGDAVVHIDPPDDIEAGQLELFTGRRRLKEPITEAVLVVCRDDASAALLDREPLTSPDAAGSARARTLFGEWLRGTERKTLGVRVAIARDAIGDPLYDSYFAGQFESEDLGRFLLLVDPSADEPVSLGQFVRWEIGEKSRRWVRRIIRRHQRRGRMLGLELDDIGVFDQWVLTSLYDSSGQPVPSATSFEPTHYDLEVAIEEGLKAIAGRARIRLEAVSGGTRVVALGAHPDVVVSRAFVSDGPGSNGTRELPLLAERGGTHVVLSEAPAAGSTVELTVEFRGALLLKIEGNRILLLDTISWYPHAGRIDQATYSVRLEWPDEYDVIAAGTHVESGEKPDRRWERRRYDAPVKGYSFEIGRFKLARRQVGHVQVTAAFDSRSVLGPVDSDESLLKAVDASLPYLEGLFGQYPLDQLTLVTSPRSSADGVLGFITVPSEDWYYGMIARELAHQWWGHVVGWTGYRELWLSEAMADYGKMLWARDRRDEKDRIDTGVAGRWLRDLTAVFGDGRPVESTGPLVLGPRLVSSKGDALEEIVHGKGSRVLGTLSQVFGEKPFLEAQRALLQAARFRTISTEDYLRAMEQMSGTDLGWFADRYIYGTGIPEIRYTYTIERDEDAGGWFVRGTARQRPSTREVCRVIQLSDDRFDLRCRPVPLMDIQDSALVVPFQVAAFNPETAGGDRDASHKQRRRSRKRGDRTTTYNTMLRGRTVLRGETTDFTVPSPYEPRRVWLDRDQLVFGRFIDETRSELDRVIGRAEDARAAEDAEETIALLERAYALGDDSSPSLSSTGHRRLAHAYLDLGRLDEARATMVRAKRDATPFTKDAYQLAFDEVAARAAVLRGDHERALSLLTGPRRSWRMRGPRRHVLLAIAAKALGHEELYRSALESAREHGADVSLLEQG